MNTLTHALLPVIAVSLKERKLIADTVGRWDRKRIAALAVLGAMPDLVNPHFSLEARFTSWSHGLPALLVVALLLGAATKVNSSGLTPRFAACLILAYALHLTCDAISGGIAWLYPLADGVLGGRWFPFILWIPLDLTLLVTSYFIFRAIPRYRIARNRIAPDPKCSEDTQA